MRPWLCSKGNPPDALVILDCPFLPFESVVDFALQQRLPTMAPYALVTRRGGLLSYGADVTAMARRAAVFVARSSRVPSPANLPVEQPTKFELVVNLKTAKALGLTIPQLVLLRADEVIR